MLREETTLPTRRHRFSHVARRGSADIAMISADKMAGALRDAPTRTTSSAAALFFGDRPAEFLRRE